MARIRVYARNREEMGGLLDTISSAIAKATPVLTDYYTAEAKINLLKAQAKAASQVPVNPTTVANATGSTVSQYMPYIIGGVALVALVMLVKK
jgi:hypothetical protein